MPTSESQLETLDLILKDLGSVWAMDPDLALTDSNSSVNGYELCQHSYVSVKNIESNGSVQITYKYRHHFREIENEVPYYLQPNKPL